MQAPESRTLPALLAEQARAAGDHPALRCTSGDRTYAELARRAEEVRAALAGLGVRRGDTVALLAPNRPEWLDAAFGILATGARAAAFNTWVKAWDLDYLLTHSAASTLIMAARAGGNDLLGELRSLLPEAWDAAPGQWRSERFPALRQLVVLDGEIPEGALAWEDLPAGAAEPSSEGSEPEDVAFVLYTSGSSEYPKAVPLVHRGLIENGFNIGERQGMRPDDRVWFAAPLFWSFGGANALMATLTHGATMVLEPGFDAAGAAATIAEQRCTVAYLLPTIADALVRESGQRIRSAGSLRTGVMIGRPDELRRAVEALGVPELCNVYGSTETYGNCCVTPHDAQLERRLISQGPPLEGVELRIVDPDSRAERPTGEPGEIEVRGYVTPGYLGDAAAAARATTADGWYRTGDLGTIDTEGWLTYAGRATEMIKSSGINVSPAEIERFLSSHPEVAEVVVAGAPHPVKGEAAVAFVSLQAGSSASGRDLVAYCKGSIAGYKVPEVVVVCDEIPRTVTGKVSRRALEERAAAAIDGSAEPAR